MTENPSDAFYRLNSSETESDSVKLPDKKTIIDIFENLAEQTKNSVPNLSVVLYDLAARIKAEQDIRVILNLCMEFHEGYIMPIILRSYNAQTILMPGGEIDQNEQNTRYEQIIAAYAQVNEQLNFLLDSVEDVEDSDLD
ncbi:MAG: hypothetical protein OHK0017_12270 [Patescibacteria group bacterium]